MCKKKRLHYSCSKIPSCTPLFTAMIPSWESSHSIRQVTYILLLPFLELWSECASITSKHESTDMQTRLSRYHESIIVIRFETPSSWRKLIRLTQNWLSTLDDDIPVKDCFSACLIYWGTLVTQPAISLIMPCVQIILWVHIGIHPHWLSLIFAPPFQDTCCFWHESA